MEANTIQKYRGKSIAQLIRLATKPFNKFIRERDFAFGCISCGERVTQAGHYRSAGHHPHLRFNEQNVNGQCTRCNLFLRGNLIDYRKGLVKKIGILEVDGLESIRVINFKWDRFTLIAIIEKYRDKIRSHQSSGE